MGFIPGRNVAIDHRYAENQNDRLPALAAELVHGRVAVIYAGDNVTTLTTKAATATIPIVFRIGGDPVQLGLVSSLNRPGGNITGVSFLATTTAAIRLQMLHEAAPNAIVIGLLVNPSNPLAEPDTRETRDAARKLGIALHVATSSNAQQVDGALAALVQQGAQALVIEGDPLFMNGRQQLAGLTARHAMPAIFSTRDFPEAGGLMSYGANIVDADRLGGVYVGRILKGDKPADLPIQQSVRVELIINMTAAKALGLTLPISLLGRADEVIE
jgi:putative ABC transport system substrate-binding protein